MFALPGRTVLAADHRLNPVEQLLVDDRWVLALVLLAGPDEVAVIEGVSQHLVNGAHHHPVAFACPEPFVREIRLQPPDRIPPRGVELEHLPNERSPFLVELDSLIHLVVPVAQRRQGGKLPLLCLLQKPLSRLLGEVVDVVLGHQHLDAVDELLVGAGVLVQHRPFLDEDQRHVQVVDDHVVLEVSVQPVCLLAENGTHLRLLLEVLHHLVEVCTSALLGGLHVNELADDLVAVFPCVGSEQFLLGGDGVALPLLLFRGYSGIENCFVRGECFLFHLTEPF